ncbi:hypothetical protein [Polaribacter sp.]|jgi:uncharacterized protein YeeX (DUF496 family)|uniref:hypothetical protein n=1 Tax=Polaribacter sp. TaxID=1920175 RepID=UPI003EEE130F
MQQDIRELLRNYKEKSIEMSANHASKFEDLLQKKIHQKKPKKYYKKWMSVAASVVLLVSLAINFYPTQTIDGNLDNSDAKIESSQSQISLGSISPEFQTIETYYRNSIKLEISQLEMTEENKEIVDGYLFKIAELTKEYKSLTNELNTKGVNDATIDALIRNLQLRLQLLKRLQKQLKNFKTLNTKQNETQIL